MDLLFQSKFVYIMEFVMDISKNKKILVYIVICLESQI